MSIQISLSQMLARKYGAVAEAMEILIEQLSQSLGCDHDAEWGGVELADGGFYATPAERAPIVVRVCSHNHFKHYLSAQAQGFSGVLSANAFGLMVSRIAMNVIANRANSEQFREYCNQLDCVITQHPEAELILLAL